MRALWSDRQNCSHNVSQKVKRIRGVSENKDPKNLLPLGILLNNLDCDMFKPSRSHRGLLSGYSGRVLEDEQRFQRGFLQRNASMRALWSDKQNCSHPKNLFGLF